MQSSFQEEDISSDYYPSTEEIAQLLITNGLEPQRNETDQVFQSRVDRYVNENIQNMNELQHYKRNREQILNKMKRGLKIKIGFIITGNCVKWIRTSYSFLSKFMKVNNVTKWKDGYSGLAKISMKNITVSQKMMTTIQKTLKSKTTWIVSAVVCTIQIGYESYRYWTGEIDGSDFALNSLKIIGATAVGIVGSACGAAIGAAIGAAFSPIGSIIGAVIGGLIAGALSAWAAEQAIDKIKSSYLKKEKEVQSIEQVQRRSMTILELPLDFTLAQLEDASKAKFSQFHPDKYEHNSEQTKNSMKGKCLEAMQAYEILIQSRK